MNYYCKNCGSLETAPSIEKIIELEKLCLSCKSSKSVGKKTCKICGNDFITVNGRQVYCSEKCRKDSYRIMAMDHYTKTKGVA